MKKFFFFICILTCVLQGCKTYNEAIAIPSSNPLPQQLEQMDINVSVTAYPYRIQSAFQDYVRAELNKNFVKKSASNKFNGKIEVEAKIRGNAFAWWSGVPYLFPIELVGFPNSLNDIEVFTKIKILDKNGNVANAYEYPYAKKIVTGLYYGRSLKRMSLDAAKEIMNSFREDYINDFQTTIARLQEPLTEEKFKRLPPATVFLMSPIGKKREKLGDYDIYVNDIYVCHRKVGEYIELKVPHGLNKIEIKDVTSTYIWGWNTHIAYYISGKTYYVLCRPYLFDGCRSYSTKDEYLNYRNNGLITKSISFDASQFFYAENKFIKNDIQIKESTVNIANNNSSITDHKSAPPAMPVIQQLVSRVDNNIPEVSIKSSETYVLIIANENYNLLDNVNYAAHDGQIFKEYCLKTLGVPERQIFYYENASFGQIVDGVGKLQYCLNNFEGAKGIVYYCGHGIPDEKTGQAFLIPVDGKGTNMTTCYSLNTLYKTLSNTKAQSITYFMDACFTGANKEGSMLVAARGVARAPEKEVLTGKTVVFSASSGDETAMTLNEEGHGLFTYYLLKKLQETEGNVTYGELADYINQNVKKDAFLINEKPQTPVVATSPAVVNTWRNMNLK